MMAATNQPPMTPIAPRDLVRIGGLGAIGGPVGTRGVA